MFSIIIIIFSASVFIYSINIGEATKTKEKLEANKLCLEVASTINSFASLGQNSTYSFDLASSINYADYTIWIISDQRYVKIMYGDTYAYGAGCDLQTINISHVNGSRFFQLEKNATLKNNGGVLTIES